MFKILVNLLDNFTVFKIFNHKKNLWQVSFLILLLPFLYFNKETFLSLVQLKNFYLLFQKYFSTKY